MNTPIAAPDPTKTTAWVELARAAKSFVPDLRGWFLVNPARATQLTFQASSLRVDLSKNLIDPDILEHLFKLAEQMCVLQRRDEMFAGERINVSENRSVLHTALRLPPTQELWVEGKNVVTQVQSVLERMYEFASQVRSGQYTGISGKPLTQILSIGIGGSDLGAKMAYQALHPYVLPGLSAHFVSNVDPSDVGETLQRLDPETTLVIVVSKTFTTQETMANAQVAKKWLISELEQRGILPKTATTSSEKETAIAKHFVAVSMAKDKVSEFGITPENTFGFWEWVGGRYSADSAVGLALLLCIGTQNFQDLLAGFYALDRHFVEAKPTENVPLLMGLINVWYANFLGFDSHAILPYSQQLQHFPAFLQQLTMESNGKRVRWDGAEVSYDTGEIFWGEPGTNGQHAFFQLLHQGTRVVPADFIAFANPAFAVKCQSVDAKGERKEADLHELLLANFLAQTRALAFGQTETEAQARGIRANSASAHVFLGNRPSTSIMAPALTPFVLGQLIALYEHVTFVEGAVWGVNSFDQWGVELGKSMAAELLPAIESSMDSANQNVEELLDRIDPSTREMIRYYQQSRLRPEVG